jgi:6-phosphogluconolactonase
VSQIRRWHIYPEASDLVSHATRGIIRSAHEAISAHGQFTVCLAGGSTPRMIYQRLAKMQSNWSKWHVYFGDERCRSIGHEERNDKMAFDAFLSHVAIPKTQIWTMPGEMGAKAGAARYLEDITHVEQFDLVLLGIGEDGHTASLFPNSFDPYSIIDVVPVEDAPKPPPERISLSAACLARSRQVLFLVTGESKRAAVAAWRAGKNIPAASITPANGVDILIDAAAWPDGPV